jgi:hypothetical protein
MDIALCWASRSLITPYSPEMLSVVRNALPRNRALGVTGALCFTPTSFFQVLEGPPQAVRAVFASIEADWRHTQVTRIDEKPIRKRLFGGHEMKFVDAQRSPSLGHPVEFDAVLAMAPTQRRELAVALMRA